MTITVENTPLAVYSANDAGFRAWAKAWHDTFIALDLTEVHNAIDFDTVTMPTTASTAAGYRVYELNDSKSADRPVYLKVSWGRGIVSNTSYGFRVDITVGQTHNAGAVGGYTATQYFQMECAPTGDGEIIGVRGPTGIVLYSNIPMDSKYQAIVLVERFAINDVPTTDGVFFIVGAGNVNTTGTTGGDPNGCLINFVTGTTTANTAFATPAPALLSYSLDRSYMSKAPLYFIQTYGGYDPLSLIYQTGGQPLGVDNAVFTGTVKGQQAVFRTPNGCRWASVSYVRPAIRMG